MIRSTELELLTATVARVAEVDPARVAIRGTDAQVTYRELGDRLSEAASRPVTGECLLPVSGLASDVVELLTRAAAGRSVLVLDAQTTAWERERAGALTPGDDDPDRPQWLALCTSGTSGLPKVVPLRWSTDVLPNALAFAEAAGYREDDVVWCGTPLHHRYCLAAGVLGGLLAGSTLLLVPGMLGPAEFGRRLRDERVTVLLSVPYLYGFYARELARDPQTPRGVALRRCVAAGEPLPEQVATAWREATGLTLLSHLGSTEDGQLTLGRGEPDEGVGLPLADTEIRVDADGVIATRRRTRPADDGDLFRVPGRGTGGWRRTGDVGRLDDRGNVHITGRATERLNVAGKKVDPVEVEQALRMCPGVSDCVVAGVSGPTGDDLVGFVVAGGTPSDADLRRHLGELLSPHKVPRRFVRLDRIPRTRTGKPQRGQLVAGLLASGPALSGPASGPALSGLTSEARREESALKARTPAPAQAGAKDSEDLSQQDHEERASAPVSSGLRSAATREDGASRAQAPAPAEAGAKDSEDLSQQDHEERASAPVSSGLRSAATREDGASRAQMPAPAQAGAKNRSVNR